jgi:hypothetical protein
MTTLLTAAAPVVDETTGKIKLYDEDGALFLVPVCANWQNYVLNKGYTIAAPVAEGDVATKTREVKLIGDALVQTSEYVFTGEGADLSDLAFEVCNLDHPNNPA